MNSDKWLEYSARAWPWYLLVLILLLFDQFTKLMASHWLAYARPKELTFFFDLTLLHNRGAAFSFLSDASGWQRWFFVVLSLGVSVAITLMLPLQKTLLARASLTLILAGALGNLIDRVRLGYVVDFISLHYQGWYFPAFNIADSCISVGAVLLIVQWIQESRDETHD